MRNAAEKWTEDAKMETHDLDSGYLTNPYQCKPWEMVQVGAEKAVFEPSSAQEPLLTPFVGAYRFEGFEGDHVYKPPHAAPVRQAPKVTFETA